MSEKIASFSPVQPSGHESATIQAVAWEVVKYSTDANSKSAHELAKLVREAASLIQLGYVQKDAPAKPRR